MAGERPNVCGRCADCQFSEKAVDKGKKIFPGREIDVYCREISSGGFTQIEPGIFAKFTSRAITVMPQSIDTSAGCEGEWLEGHITMCPGEISDAEEKFSYQPDFDWVTVHRGHESRSKLRPITSDVNR